MHPSSRPPETTPDARESAAQENDARRTAEAVSGAAPASISSASSSPSVGTRLQITPAPNDAEASLQASASQIARVQSAPEQQNTRAASEAYQSQAAAQTQITQEEKGNGSQSINVMA